MHRQLVRAIGRTHDFGDEETEVRFGILSALKLLTNPPSVPDVVTCAAAQAAPPGNTSGHSDGGISRSGGQEIGDLLGAYTDEREGFLADSLNHRMLQVAGSGGSVQTLEESEMLNKRVVDAEAEREGGGGGGGGGGAGGGYLEIY